MHRDHGHIRTQAPLQLVHFLLDKRNQGTEIHSLPDGGGKPGTDIRVRTTQHQHLQPGPPQQGIFLKVGRAVRLQRIGGKKRDSERFKLRGYAVVNGMSGFDVMIAGYDRIIAHRRIHARTKVGRNRIDIVEIINAIIPLEKIPGIDEQHIPGPFRPAHGIDEGGGAYHRRMNPPAQIGGIEYRAVDVIGGENRQPVRPARTGGKDGGQQRYKEEPGFHLRRSLSRLKRNATICCHPRKAGYRLVGLPR